MKSKFKFLGFLLVLAVMLQGVSFGQNADAQKVERKKKSSFSRYWYASLNGGIAMFWGDVQDRSFMEKLDKEDLNFTGGLTIGHQVHPIWGYRGNFQIQNLASVREGWNQEMEAKGVFDYTFQGTMSLLNLIRVNEDRRVDIYGFLGIGFSNWKTERRSTVTGKVLERHGDSEEHTRGFLKYTSELVMPFGAGISVRLTPCLALGLEQTWKIVNSDYLDAKDSGDASRDFYSNTTANLIWQFRGGNGNIKKMVKNYDQVTIAGDPEVLERHGNKIDVTVKGNVPEDYFNSKAAMKVIPKLVYANGKEKFLDPIYLRGEKTEGKGQVVTDEGANFSKGYTIDWEDGMENAKLVAETLIYMPKDNIVNEDETNAFLLQNTTAQKMEPRALSVGTIITGQQICFNPKVVTTNPYSLNDNASYGMLAQVAAPADKMVSDKATVYFRVNMSNLNWRLPLNRNNDVKADINQLKDFLNRGWKIKGLEINAWASPEGEENYNQRLSERRAETGRKLLKKVMKEVGLNYNDYSVSVNARGEDWNGFEAAVMQSNIAEKNIILNVIRSNSDLTRREAEIRKMALVYKSVEKEILPMLRRTELAAITLEPKLSNQELVSGAKSKSSTVKDVESYLYAATLVNNLDEKVKIYQNAIKMYPNNATAHNNLGYVYFIQGKTKKAKSAYEKAISINPNEGVALNNLGIIYGMKGDLNKAEDYFNKAQQNGVDAAYNKGLINITKGNYSQALSLMGNRSCDYNVALAQLLSGNLNKAKSTISCAPETAKKDYLMAVISSRMNDKDETFKYLVKTMKANKKMAKKLKKDKEFAKYFDMPEFKALFK
ncbi:MAG: hypothetical protein CSA94_00885 [Bacteroidetes bacterium]|nr:MAG: hypothetical protein CSA94_00885 [Bacteroidota bacterium]